MRTDRRAWCTRATLTLRLWPIPTARRPCLSTTPPASNSATSPFPFIGTGAAGFSRSSAPFSAETSGLHLRQREAAQEQVHGSLRDWRLECFLVAQPIPLGRVRFPCDRQPSAP